MPKVSIVIPVYHALDELKDCLQSLEKIDELDSAEIIIINDCPGSETADFLHQYAASHAVRLEDNPQNMGFIKSCNKGMSLAQSPIIVLLNTDTIVPRKFLKKTIACFDSNSKIACAAPLGNWIERAALPADAETCDALAEAKAGDNSYIKTLVPNGFCFCIRKKALEQIGGFDEVFGKGYCEENDLSCRALQAGYENVVMTNAYVWHKGSASFGATEASERIRHNRKILDARWKDFVRAYKEDNRELFKDKKYLKRFYPWYRKAFNLLRGLGLCAILWALPQSQYKQRLKRFK